MGSFLSLCSPEGGPCSGTSSDIERANRRPHDSKEALLKPIHSHAPTEEYPDGSSDSDDSIQGSRERTSIFTMPTKTISIAPVLSNYVFPNERFKKIRKKNERMASELSDIDKVTFCGTSWLIQGTDSISLDQHRDVFDIVIWRVPIIPAFACFQNENEFYTKICTTTDAGKHTEGIWSVLSKEEFIGEFGEELLQQIDKIDSDNSHSFSYLPHDELLPFNSDEYKTLIDQLDVIQPMKINNEIVIIGQKESVQNLLRIIRQKEVKHPSMIPMFKREYNSAFEWEIELDSPNAPDPSVICSYCCTLMDIPFESNDSELDRMMSNYSRWVGAEFVDDSEEENATKYRLAKVVFDDEKCFNAFVDDIEAGKVMMGGNEVSIQTKDKQIIKRKQRKLRPFHLIV